MATGICYTQSGTEKRYEVDCVKGIRTFCWPSYTCMPTRLGIEVTSYMPIDNYVCCDLKSFPSYQKNPNLKLGTMAFYGTYISSISFYIREFGHENFKYILQQNTFSYNSYACSDNVPYKSLDITHFIGVDKELFPDRTSMQTMQFEDNNMASFGVQKFGLMTLYGEDYSTGKYKNYNYRYSFIFNLYPEVDLTVNYLDCFQNFKYNNININENYPYKNFIYRIDITNNRVRYYYGKYRPTNYKNPLNDNMSGFINEISGVSNVSYFGIYRDKLFSNKPVNDINKNYHHFAVTGIKNNYGRGVSYTYYGKLNGLYEQNKLSYSLPNYTKTVNVDSTGWTYVYPPNYSGILTDIYSSTNDTRVTFTFSYFSMLAEYAE